MTIGRKIALYIIAVLIVTSLIIYFVILPTINDIKTINQAVYNEKLDLEKKYLRGQLLRKTIEDFEKIKPEQDKINSIFIKQGNELEFITALENIAANYNLEQKLSLRSDLPADSGIYYPLPLEISIRGNFINILKYLNDLEKLDYYFNIAELAVTAGQATENFTDTKLNGEIYMLSSSSMEQK